MVEVRGLIGDSELNMNVCLPQYVSLMVDWRSVYGVTHLLPNDSWDTCATLKRKIFFVLFLFYVFIC